MTLNDWSFKMSHPSGLMVYKGLRLIPTLYLDEATSNMKFIPLDTSTPTKSGIPLFSNPPMGQRKACSCQQRETRASTSVMEDCTPPSSPVKGIPSLLHPPQAPRRDRRPLFRPWILDGLRLPFPIRSKTQKRRVMRRLRQEEREQYESWPIRPKYLSWTPMEVEELKDVNLLEFLYQKYGFPASQPRNSKEEAFFDIMKETILFTLMSVKANSQ